MLYLKLLIKYALSLILLLKNRTIHSLMIERGYHVNTTRLFLEAGPTDPFRKKSISRPRKFVKFE
jgi:hypothetical protein